MPTKTGLKTMLLISKKTFQVKVSGGNNSLFQVRPQLFEGWITLSTAYIAIQWISVNKTNHAIHWIVIYLVGGVIHLSNNSDQDPRFSKVPETFRARKAIFSLNFLCEENLCLH